jgi:hypothetical protein
VSKRMIAGISKGLPITGTSASAYLKKIRTKKQMHMLILEDS